MKRVKVVRLWIMPVLLSVAASAMAAGVELVEAVKAVDRPAIRNLIGRQVDVNAPDPDGATALHWAAYNDDLETAELLIRAGAKASIANRYGVTPLTLACNNANANMVEILLKAGADPNTVLPEGETALMSASRTGNARAVGALLAHGADAAVREEWRGQTALMWAAAEGHTEVVRTLLAHGAPIGARSNAGFTAFLFAVREGKVGAAQALLEAGADINETLMVRRRAANNAPPTDPVPGPSALMLAVANAHFELASMLLERGANADADTQGWTALHQITAVRKPGAGGNNPAPLGSGAMDSIEMVRRLIRHGANINARVTGPLSVGTTDLNLQGATAFLLAARTADAELMRLLAELGADPLLPNGEGTTPLMVAAGVGTRSPGEDPGSESEVLEAVQVAYELGGDLNTVDKNGQTAMHGTAYKQVPSVAEFLVEKGARVETWHRKNMNGWTPLRIAVGVHRGMNFRSSPAVAAVLERTMKAAGISTEVEPEGVISGRTR